MSPITTHVLDTAKGIPAQGVPIVLKKKEGEDWKEIASGVTNSDGRVANFLEGKKLEKGTYRMVFDTKTYFSKNKTEAFYPYVLVVFEIQNPSQHYHVPLLLSPFGYSTYRGS